jgi:hypothetical protein
MLRPLLFIAISCAVASAQPAPAPAKTHVAVIPGVAVNVDPTRVDALTQDLADALDAALVVDAVGGLEIRRLLRADLPPDCVTKPACVQEVARATHAQQLLFVVMIDTGGGAISVDSTWVDVASGTSASRPPVSLTTAADSDAKDKFQLAATSLFPNLPVTPKVRGVGIEGKMIAATPRHITLPAMITAGTTVVGLGMWIGFGLDARSKYNACQSEVNAEMICSDNRRSGIKHLDIGADIGWGLALASAVATGVLYATSGEGTHLIVSPTEGTGASVFAVGRF